MGQERPDMFDVACGECALLDFLLTRFNPLELKTKINLAPSALVDEQIAPIKAAPDLPEIQAPPDPPPSTLAFIASVKPPEPPPPPPPPPPPKGPDWLSLIQGFHAAAQRYQAEIEVESDPPDEGP